MLAGDRAAERDAEVEDLAARRSAARSASPGIALVVEDERVQVAVAGVEDVADAHAVLDCQLADPPQHLGQARARHDAVLHVVARADTRPIAPNAPCAPSTARALGASAADALLVRAARRGRCPRRRANSDATSGARAVELDQQHRPGVGKPGVDGRLDGLDRERVHHLDRGRHDARGDDAGDREAAGVAVSNAASSVSTRLRARHRPTVDLGDDAERPLGADDDAEQVVARRVGHRARRGARCGRPAARTSSAEHVVRREPVLQAVRAAGVLRDVAADRADLLARGVGRVVAARAAPRPR